MSAQPGPLAARLAALQARGLAGGVPQKISAPSALQGANEDSEEDDGRALGSAARGVRAGARVAPRVDLTEPDVGSPTIEEVQPMQGSAQLSAPGSMVARVLRREDPKSLKAVRFEGISGEASRDSPSLSGSAVIAPAPAQAANQDATRCMPAKELHQAAKPPAKRPVAGWEFLNKHHAQPILMSMLESLPKEIDEAGEENERSTEKAGILLLSYILPELDLMCVGTSRFAVPSWESKVESMMNLLVNRGGKVGSANNRARLFLRDFVEFLAVMRSVRVCGWSTCSRVPISPTSRRGGSLRSSTRWGVSGSRLCCRRLAASGRRCSRASSVISPLGPRRG
jgi:hypothetical protein